MWKRLITGVAVVAVVAGCSEAGSSGRVVVSAASSLTDVFAQLEVAFEAAHPDVDVVLNIAASSTLREQILSGAPVDVFAPADPSHMAAVVAAGSASDPVPFALNRLQIAVPAGNPGGVTGLGDLERDELLLGLCVPAAPCGHLARSLLEVAGVDVEADTEEPNVRALLTKIVAGELDAGIVYATDVMAAAGAVEGIAIDRDGGVRAEYQIAVLTGSASPDAGGFVAFVLSPDGRAVLDEYGFGSP